MKLKIVKTEEEIKSIWKESNNKATFVYRQF